MSKQILKIEMNELAKSVSCEVKLEIEREIGTEDLNTIRRTNDYQFEEVKRLFEKAQEYSKLKTLEKERSVK